MFKVWLLFVELDPPLYIPSSIGIVVTDDEPPIIVWYEACGPGILPLTYLR